MTKKNKSITEVEGAEYGVDSRYSTRKAKNEDGKALMEARLERLKNLSKEQIAHAKLLQLKLKMEEYIKTPVYNEHHFFTEFLTMYIDTIYNKRNAFAKDIEITPIFLSQVLNNHREPTEEFMLRLMIHSERAFKKVCKFQKEIWYEVYYHEKICGTMSSQNKWKPKEEKHVKLSTLVNI